MARHVTRSRAEDAQSAPEEVKSAANHREPHVGRKHPKAATESNPNQHCIQKPTQRASPPRGIRKHADRTMVSVAGVFKRDHKGSRQDKRSRRQKERTPELMTALEDGLHEARWAISTNTRDTFEKVHAGFNQHIKALQKDDKEFFKNASYKASLLSAPLTEEKLETRARRNGEDIVQVVEIGKRVAEFKTLIDKEEEKLTDLWRQWDGQQEEYIKLGVEVFGPQKFGEGAAPYEDLPGGYKKDMEHWKLEHNANVEEIDDEIEGIGVKILHKMKTAEKQLDAAAKKEQAQLLQSIME